MATDQLFIVPQGVAPCWSCFHAVHTAYLEMTVGTTDRPQCHMPAALAQHAALSTCLAWTGLPHYMANLDCQPAEYLQIFNNIDPGLITLATALSHFQPFVLQASNSTATAATLGAFGMDAACMSRCRSRFPLPVQQQLPGLH